MGATLAFRLSIFDRGFTDGPRLSNPKSKIESRKWLVVASLLAAPVALAQPEPTPETPVYEATERVLIDRSLAQRPVRLVSISADSIEVTDPIGHVLSLARTQVLALIPPLTNLDQAAIEERVLNQQLPASERARVYGRLDLVDGQSLPGSLGVAHDKAGQKNDRLSWASKLFGAITLPLDAVRMVLPTADRIDSVPVGPLSQDAVLLINGDRSEGFVSGIDSSVRIEKGGHVTDLPLSRVAAVLLANPPKPAQGAWVWLYDGTAAAASQLAVDSSGHATLMGNLADLAKQPMATMDANDLRAICFDAGAIRALASCPFVTSPARSESPERRWIPPLSFPDGAGMPLGAVDIEIPGPMTVEWTLPAGATRLGTIAELPPSARVWGDCELVVESVAGTKVTQLVKSHLNGSQPTAEVDASIAGASKLRLTIEAGPSGPIQDRVVLRRPVVLVEGKR